MASHDCKFKKTCKTLDTLYPPTTKFNKMRRKLRELTLISEENCRKCFSPMGNAGYIFEKERQLNQYSNMIHPYSKFRQIWEGLILTETIMSLMFRLFVMSQLETDEVYISYQIPCLIADVIEMTDEILGFVTGYVDKETREVIMECPQIYSYNIRRFSFYFGFIAALPYDIIFFLLRRYKFIKIISRYFIFVKICRLYKAYRYWLHAAKIYNWGDNLFRIVVTGYIFLIIVHWLSCLFYMVIFLDDFGPSENKFESESAINRHLILFHMVCSILFFQNSLLPCLKISLAKDLFFASFFLLVTSLLQAVILGFLVQLYCFKKTSFTRYWEMVEEAQKFTTQENLPKEISIKIKKYFEFRFRGRFFREKYILETLSPPLRREIAYFLCYGLLKAPESIFNGVSKELALDLCLQMKFEIFLPGDEVINEGKQASKIYFIICGSFSVYSSRRNEIQHLYNGAQFGHAAFSTTQVYALTVLALEMSECYSLKYSDFLSCASNYPEFIGVVTNAADIQRRRKRALIE